MSQNTNSSASSEEYGNLIEEADEHETDASAGELAAMSSSSLIADPDESFFGKVKTNVSNMISKLFRSPKEEVNSPKHNHRHRTLLEVANIASASNDDVPRTNGQRKRKHSLSVSPSGSGGPYAEVIRKRSRLNIATEAVAQPAESSLVNGLSRVSTPNSAQLCSAPGEIRRRPFSKSAAGRYVQTRRAATQNLCRRVLADCSANRNIVNGVGRTSPWAMPSDSMPYGLSNKNGQLEYANGHDSEQDCIPRFSRSTNSPIEEKIDGASATSDKQEHPDGVDNLSYSAGGDRASEPYVPFGNQQKFESALKAANPSRRYSTFLGNAVVKQSSKKGSTSSPNFWSHDGKSPFHSGNTYERPAFNPSVSSNSCFKSYFYDGVPRYGGASAAPYNQSRLNRLRTPLPLKRPATGTVVSSTMISTQSQIIQTILDNYSAQNAEKRRDEANDLLRQEKTLMEDSRRLLESCSQAGSGLMRLQKPATPLGLINQRVRNATSNNKLLVPQMQQMMATSPLQQTDRAASPNRLNYSIGSGPNAHSEQAKPAKQLFTAGTDTAQQVTAPNSPTYSNQPKASHPVVRPNGNRFVFSSPAILDPAVKGTNVIASRPGTENVDDRRPPSFQQLIAATSAGNKWQCDVCLVCSDQSATKCVACASTKPLPKASASRPGTENVDDRRPPSFQQLIAATSAGNKWQCDVCLVCSDQSALKCVACASTKPLPKTTTPSPCTTPKQ